MSELEFIIMAIELWPALGLLSILFAFTLFFTIRRVIVGGIFDPLVLVLVASYSVNYAVVVLLWTMDKSTLLLTGLVMGYGVVMLSMFRWVSMSRRSSLTLAWIRRVSPRRVGPIIYIISLTTFFALGLLVVSVIGFGIFAETNRFDAARGLGAYIRILDFLGPFIISYSTASIFSNPRRRLLKVLALVFFIFLAAMLNGAKISVIFSIFTVFFTLSIMAVGFKIRPGVIAACMLMGLAFAIVALGINLKKNNVEESVVETQVTGNALIIERFGLRMIANGDSSYLLLPNNVIDKIARDNALIRFIVPIFGITASSKIFGYPVDDYSVGRQALLYYDPHNEISGGPTSHFDLFGYVYFGPLGGFVFAAAVGLLLGSINSAIRFVRCSPITPPNHFRIALLVTLWTRAVLIIIEPTVAFAFILDVLIFFSAVSLIMQSLGRKDALQMGQITPNKKSGQPVPH